MGEAALSSVVFLEEEEDDVDVEESKMVRWERFLPRMSLGVLLVEGDDSTRQIIAALLRKCNYKVAAVPDGLRAWEVLKEKAHNIDIILTEVDLPSVSGFSLLTMIMGHENCKSIPVIMMSSHDSISVVFKCMLAGAADFLIKPIRKNELRNLWQHVWRREASSDLKRRHQDGNLVPQNFNTTENLAASNHSSACMQKNRECSEKGSDAQSSCTKPDTEAESEYMHNTWQLLQSKPRNTSLAMDTSMHEGDADAKLTRLASEGASCEKSSSTEIILLEKHAYTGVVRKGEEVGLPKFQEDANVVNETDCNKKQVEAPREAIDLIGAINYQPQYSYQQIYHTASHGKILNSAENLTEVNGVKCKLSSPPQLELSLRSPQPTGCKSQETEERCTLNHSNASPFSRYNNRTVPSPLLSPENFSTEPRESWDSQKPSPEQSPVDAAGVQQYRLTQSNGQEETNPQVVGADQEKKMLPFHQLGIVPVPVPAGGMPLDSFYAGYGSLLPPIFYPQTHPPGSPPWSTNSSSQQEAACVNSSHQSNPETRDSVQNNLSCDQNADKPTSEAVPVQDQILESEQGTRHVPSIAGQSGSSTLCNSSRSHLNSNGCGSVCNGSKMTNTAAAAGGAPSEGGNGEGLLARDGVRTLDYQRFSQREAALTKFRLKRKDRCFEKKVRYQSRKRLAEQRPRVKGQFVRQVQPDPYPPSVETD